MFETETTFDGAGQYALLGFIDTYIHVDSTFVILENLSELIVSGGTLTLLADPMEIANVAGFEGMQVLLNSIAKSPYRILIEVSSRVPTAPGLQTAGGKLDPSKVLGLRDEYLIPTAEDVPARIESVILEVLETSGPYGVKGVGEIGLVPTSPAIANAVFNAVGVRAMMIPITPESVTGKVR